MRKNKLSFLAASIAMTLSVLACNLGAAPQENPVTPPPANATESAPPVEPPTEMPQEDPAAAAGACANPYLPIVAGATWMYTLTGPVPDTFTRSILSVDANGFTDQDSFGSGVTRQGTWGCENGNLTANNPSSGSSASVDTEGTSVQFQTTAMSGVTLPASINIGDSWTQSLTLEGTQTISGTSYPASNQMTNTCTAAGMESATVAAGPFDALRVECQTTMIIGVTMNGNPIQTTLAFGATSWYAMNIGLIKTVSTGSGMDSTTELVSYSIP